MEMKNCKGCGTEFAYEKLAYGGNVQQYCERACQKRVNQRRRDRQATEEYRSKRRARSRALSDSQYVDDPQLQYHIEGETTEDTVGTRFARAMIERAVNDLRDEKLSTDARCWLAGENDSELPEICRAAVCFEAIGVSHSAALRGLEIN